MRFRQIGQHLGKELESDQEAVQRVLVEIVAAPENGLKQFAILREVTQQQALGEFTFVLEVVEEAALGNTRRCDQLVDRCRGETFGEHRTFCELKQTFAGVAGSAGGIFEHQALYHEYRLLPGARAETSRFNCISLRTHAKKSGTRLTTSRLTRRGRA